MRSYAQERERIGPLPYLVQAAPSRQRNPLDWLPVLRMSASLAAVSGAGFAFLKLIGAA